MKRRGFLATAAAGFAAAPLIAGVARAAALREEPALLTVSGAIANGNRGPAGPLDQLMDKHRIAFQRAHAFDFARIATLPAVHFDTVLEYDGKQHRLNGPLLTHVLKAAGVVTDHADLVLRAIDGYGAQVTLEQVRDWHFIVATQLDGAPMPLGGLGPLWAVYDPAKVPGMLDKPLPERFVHCPWGLYHIEVKARS
jgi:hypothetical protein